MCSKRCAKLLPGLPFSLFPLSLNHLGPVRYTHITYTPGCLKHFLFPHTAHLNFVLPWNMANKSRSCYFYQTLWLICCTAWRGVCSKGLECRRGVARGRQAPQSKAGAKCLLVIRLRAFWPHPKTMHKRSSLWGFQLIFSHERSRWQTLTSNR